MVKQHFSIVALGMILSSFNILAASSFPSSVRTGIIGPVNLTTSLPSLSQKLRQIQRNIPDFWYNNIPHQILLEVDFSKTSSSISDDLARKIRLYFRLRDLVNPNNENMRAARELNENSQLLENYIAKESSLLNDHLLETIRAEILEDVIAGLISLENQTLDYLQADYYLSLADFYSWLIAEYKKCNKDPGEIAEKIENRKDALEKATLAVQLLPKKTYYLETHAYLDRFTEERLASLDPDEQEAVRLILGLGIITQARAHLIPYEILFALRARGHMTPEEDQVFLENGTLDLWMFDNHYGYLYTQMPPGRNFADFVKMKFAQSILKKRLSLISNL